MIERALIDLSRSKCLVTAGERAHELAHAAHLTDLAIHVDEVVQRELRFREALRRFGLFGLLLDAHGALDEAHHVTHAEDALGNAVGMEFLERIRLFTCADELNGLSCDLLDGKRAAATGVAVHLRHDDAVEVDALGKRGRHVHDVLAGHRVDNHKDLVGLDGALDGLGFLHHLVIDVQAARRVDDDDIAQVVDGILHAFLRDGDRVLPVAAIDAHPHLIAECLELIGGSRAVHVARDEQGRVLFLLQTIRELGCGSRLARALQADEHDDVGNAAREDELRVGATQKLGELVEHDLHDVLRRSKRLEHLGGEAALLGASAELLHDFEVDVSLEQRQADLAHGGVDIFLGQAAFSAQAREYALQSLGKTFKHESSSVESKSAQCLGLYARWGA